MFYIMIGLTILFILGVFFINKLHDFCISGAFAVGITTIAILLGHILCMIAAPFDMAEIQTKHDILVYQLENVKYDNIIDNNRLELYNQIQEYNKEVVECHTGVDNFWVGCFYHNDYKDLELIEFEGS